MNVELIVEEDADSAADAAARLLANAARRGGHIALSGGTSPARAHEIAARLEPDWSNVELWWGDERCVPPDHEHSNYGMAKLTLLDRLAAQPRAVHRIRGELEPELSAAEYAAELSSSRTRFTLNLLGIGPDGHTASLFPFAPGLRERSRSAIAAEPGLDPRVARVTLTPIALENADLVLFLATGEAKAEAVARAFGGPPSPATPASMIRARNGRTLAVVDRAAAGLLRHLI